MFFKKKNARSLTKTKKSGKIEERWFKVAFTALHILRGFADSKHVTNTGSSRMQDTNSS
jgi:hypothetical protein